MRIAVLYVAIWLLCALPYDAACQTVEKRNHDRYCSTEVVNPDCTILINRLYPITSPVFQMKPGAVATVKVKNQLGFELLSLDSQATQAIAGTDQISAFVSAAAPSLKNVMTDTNFRTLASISASYVGNTSLLEQIKPDTAKRLKDIEEDLKELTSEITTDAEHLDNDNKALSSFARDIVQVYAQLQEITAPLPRPLRPNGNSKAFEELRPARIANTMPLFPDPWVKYGQWREVMLYELVGTQCKISDSNCDKFPIKDILGRASQLRGEWAANPDCSKDSDDVAIACPYKAFPSSSLKAKADAIRSKISDQSDANVPPDPKVTEALNGFTGALLRASAAIDAISASVQPSETAATLAEIDAITKDLDIYAANVYLADIVAKQQAGSVGDPVTDYSVQERDVIGMFKRSDIHKLGRQATFAVNVINLISTSAASMPSSTAKKTIATITVLYADPIFETSAGTFFSFIPNRSFTNQTNFTQNPDNSMTGCATGSTPVYCSITIAEQDKKPTVVPFAAANWRLGSDFRWAGGRRGASYFTVALGINPNTATTEYAAGFSLSWRAVMLSPLYHLGRDIHLTQGEYVGQVLCYYNPPAPTTGPGVDKCGSPSTPSPSIKQFWRGGFAIGLGIRIPSLFNGTGR